MEVAVREVEVNGGRVERRGAAGWRLLLQPGTEGYADAQIDDYGLGRRAKGRIRPEFNWRPGTTLSLAARFSGPPGSIVGTAGFGFWNAPFGPGSGLPALPQATWFFYASTPTDLPLAPSGTAGRGWFVSTVDATGPQALAWAPWAPIVLLLNQIPAVRRPLWSLVQRSLKITFRRLESDLTSWHRYALSWKANGCFFHVDGRPVLQTPFRPGGPLGFVAWIDNQYMQATATGRFGWGVLPVRESQWLEIRDLSLR